MRADGSSSLVLTYSGDPSTPYTPVAPVDCPPLEAGCVDTICVQRCDDTDGDGQADQTYNELWCVHLDGSTELVLTYQGDPSVPYTPVAPVDCEYGCVETQTYMLCDDSGSFLRRITIGAGQHVVENLQLDGVTPYTVAGTVRACGQAAECAEPATPAATVGLCLADGTPIAVVVTRDCAGTVTQDGWINLATGLFSAGSPPAGTIACGDSRSIQVSGTFCDLSPGGDVLGLVLIEYSYAGDGSISSVRLVDATTGGTYVLQGQLSTCPAGVEQPEQDLVVLCDTDPVTGAVTTFARDYRRDENGAVTGFVDYDLDGGPYTVTGQVGVCVPAECGQCESTLLCDTQQVTSPIGPIPPGGNPLANGVSWSISGPDVVLFAQRWWRADAAPATFSFSEPVTLTWQGRVSASATLTMPPGTQVVAIHANHVYNAATRVLSAGPAATATDASTFRMTKVVAWPAPSGVIGGAFPLYGNLDVTVDRTRPFQRTICRGCDGTVLSVTDTDLDGQTAYTPTGTVGACQEQCLHCDTVELCDGSACAPGARVADAAWSPRYLAAGDAGSASVRLNVPGGGAPFWKGGQVVFPNNPADPDPGNVGLHYGIAGTVQPGSACPDCWLPDDQVTITASGRARNDGPGGGIITDGRWRILRDGGEPDGAVPQLAQVVDSNRPAGTTWAFTASATVPWSDIADGRIVLTLDLETKSNGAFKQWTASDFDICVTNAAARPGCGNRFFRTVCRDCSGAVVARFDTSDGSTPYTPVGPVIADCVTCSGAGEEPCRDSSTTLLCDLPTDGEPAPTVTDTVPAPYYPYPTGSPVAGGQALWDGGTLTIPAAAGPQPGTIGTVGTLAATLQAPRPACDAGTALVTVSVDAEQLGPDAGCSITGVLALYNGPGTLLASALPPHDAPAGWSGTLTVQADVPAAALAAGNITVLVALDTYDGSPSCPGSPQQTSWELSAFTAAVEYDLSGCAAQFFRTLVTDCESGAVVAVTDTTLDGDPFTVTGEAGQCVTVGGDCCQQPPQEPCRDTEVVTLCDLEYSPQPPTPTPASSFTLSGNVGVAGPALVFSGGNLPPNGVATRTVTGLVAGAGYEFGFATSWGGSGAPNPAMNDAIYRVEILDGATVIATQQRNLSNGAGVSPGWVQQAPLQFVAPASAGVTIRITDVSEGNATNRDVYLRPDDVRSDVLTVTATPFLRAYAYDCGGALTATADSDLDGQPYTIAGEVGRCPSGEDGGSVAACVHTNTVSLCDTAADGTSTPFLRHLAYDCAGAVSGSTDIALNGIPYTPVGSVGRCVDELQPSSHALTLCDTDLATGTVTTFVRDYQRDETGVIVGYSDYTLDGAAYTPTGAVGECGGCETTQVCVRSSGRVEFLANPEGLADNSVDADWTWSPDLAGPWWPTYRLTGFPGWTTADGGTTEGTAHWVAPHPGGVLNNTGQPGEGPAVPQPPGSGDWYVRAAFTLPDDTDPASIRISTTALNADQLAVEWRLNGGAWQPVGADHNDPPYVLPPTAVPGAQPGMNEIIVHVRETVAGGGAAGLLLHVIAEYDVAPDSYLLWTRVLCDDGRVYYLDEHGVRQDALPDGWMTVPCGGPEPCARQVLERCGCDDADGDGIGEVTYTELWAIDPCDGAAPELLGAYLDGDLTQPYTPTAPVECTAAEALPGPLSTGVRNVTGTAVQDLAAAFTDVQSVSLTVLAGSVNVTMSDGTSVPVPSGVTLTWSVARDSDTALAASSFAGATAASNYLLNWTYR
ncbi:hypothetical protein [Nonomuraea recticatena]|uniref:hypothetical protein n=1 Tax=Nonomuraea recticatena TaxID=46178 RepID=UPI0036242042